MKKEKRTNLLLSAGVLIAAVLFVIFSAQIRNTVIQALSLAVGTVIPGLFPFLVLSDFACRAGLLQPKGKAVRFLTSKLFALPAGAVPCILFGLTGGYVTGIRTAVTMHESGLLTKEQAQKLGLFCVSPGLAFSVCAVGNAMLASTSAGLLLFFSCTLAAIVTGLLIPDKQKKQPASASPQILQSKAECFTKAVQNSAVVCLHLSAWMALFASLQAVFTAFLPPKANAVFVLFSEVSAGCLQAAKTTSLPLCAAVTGFAGLCIFCQLLPDLLKLNISPFRFLQYRLLQGALSALFCKIGLFLFPQLGLTQTAAKMYLSKVNPTSSFFLLLMCFIFILDLAPTKKLCYDVR